MLYFGSILFDENLIRVVFVNKCIFTVFLALAVFPSLANLSYGTAEGMGLLKSNL